MFQEFWKNKTLHSNNIYYVTKHTKNKQIYFIKHTIASPIVKGVEFDSQDAYEKIDDHFIKENCIKLNIDRLGNIRPA